MLAVLVNCLVFSPLPTVLAAAPLPFLIDYSPAPDGGRLRAYQHCILNPDSDADLSALRAAQTEPYAYLSIVEVAAGASYRPELEKRGIRILAKNAAWGSEIVDIANPEWSQFVVGTLATQAALKGYAGFFLDTADSVALIKTSTKAEADAYRTALVNLIIKLRTAYPDKKIILNRGFELLDRLEKQIDAVMVESVFETFDNRSGVYRPTDATDTEALKKIIAGIQARGKDVWVVDYVDPNDEKLARATAERIEELGCSALVTTPDLQGLPLAPLRESKRRILVLYGWDETERQPIWPIDTMTAERLQMPLEWLGYECEYLHVWKQLLPDDLRGRYAGLICDAQLDLPYEREVAFARWILSQRAFGVKILLAGELPVKQDDARNILASGLGLLGSWEAISQPDEVKIMKIDKEVMNFEAEVRPHITEFNDFRGPEGSEVFLSLRCRRDGVTLGYFDPVFVCDWGGAVLDPYVSFSASASVSLSLFDPFRFLSRIWPDGSFPAPDTTTRDGMRMLFSHIDGDGFPSLSSMKRDATCAEVVLERVLKRYPLPITVSIIEADIRGVGDSGDPARSPFYTDIARQMFALPNVQAASHTYSHPYQWIANDPDAGNKEFTHPNMVIRSSENYPEIDYDREITGSIHYIEESLLPPGKNVELLLWSGNCRPSADAINIVKRNGIENMNGGDTVISRRNPGLAAIAPRTIPWENDELQVFAPNQNEFVYTEDWRGPFYGGFQRVIETFSLTESPRRVKPVNIYYHFYSVSRLGACHALEKVYAWALSQPLHSVTAATYAALARDSCHTRVFKSGPRDWTLVNEGNLRTFRLPVASGYPDLAASPGLTGYCEEGGWIYMHTRGFPRTKVVVSEKETPRLRLVTCSAEIEFTELTAEGTSFSTRDFRPVQVIFGGVAPGSEWSVTINGANSSVSVADASGRLPLALPAEATVTLHHTKG